MPLYNCQDYVLEAIDSILNQTYSNIELIICDDASTDRSFDICSKINDKRINLIRNEFNIGNQKTLNRLFRCAKGDYIAIMDSDDISHPERIKYQLEFINYSDVIFCCGETFDQISRPKISDCESKNFNIHSIDCDPKMMASLLFKRSLLEIAGGFDDFFEQYNSGDRHFAWKLMFAAEKKFLELDAVLYYMRIRYSSLSRSFNGSIDKFLGWHIFYAMRKNGLIPLLSNINRDDSGINELVLEIKKDKNIVYECLKVPIYPAIMSGDFNGYLNILFSRIKIHPFRINSYAGIFLFFRALVIRFLGK